jgi:hypothetical protein
MVGSRGGSIAHTITIACTITIARTIIEGAAEGMSVSAYVH